MQSRVPARKVTYAAMGAAFAVVVVWVLNTAVLSDPLPEPVTNAITVVVSFVTAFAAGYAVRPDLNDQITDA